MRFIIVTQTFPPRVGGMQDVMSSLAIKLSHNYKTIVLPDHHIPFDHPILKTKINFIFSNFPKLIRNFIKKLKLRKILLPEDIIICDSWKSFSSIPTSNQKIILFAHGQEFLSKKKYVKIKKALDSSYKIICSSNYTKQLISKNFDVKKNNLFFVPPTYSTNEKEFIFKKLKNKKKIINLISVSRLDERKGHIYVLNSLNYLQKNNLIKDFKWTICGDGPLKIKLSSEIKKLNLSKKVIMLGKVLNREKSSLLNDSDLFVMPSIKINESVEGFGISYIEAAKYGIPSISGIDGGVVDAVINKKTGWNVNPLNKTDLNVTLSDAINNSVKRKKLGNNAKKYFEKYFSGEKVFKKFMDIILS